MQASDCSYPDLEDLQDECLRSLRNNDYDTAKSIRKRIQNLIFDSICYDLIQIIVVFEHRYKFVFEAIHRLDDGSYNVRWHNTVKKDEQFRVRYVNNWFHEKVQPLINDLPPAVSRYGLVLDEFCQSQSLSGKFTLRMISPDGLRIYHEFQAF